MKRKIASIVTTVFAISFLMSISIPGKTRSSTAKYARVLGTRRVYLKGENAYVFEHDTSLVLEAPEIEGWIFDHIEVDFGCQVGGVVGSNVSDIFTIDYGCIQLCHKG